MDPYQLIGSFVAILLLALFARKLFPTPDSLSLQQIMDDFGRYAPAEIMKEPLVSSDMRSAIVPLENDQAFGLVILLGDQPVCRLVTAADKPVVTEIEGGLRLNTHDFTQPACTLMLNEEDGQKLKKIITALPQEGTYAA